MHLRRWATDFLRKHSSPNSSVIPRRYRYKNKWAVNLKTGTNCQQALSNFDAFYKPYFGSEWPSIRISLLSLPKYCAVVNNFGHRESIEAQLEALDALNFVEQARILNARRRENEQFSAPQGTHIQVKGNDSDHIAPHEFQHQLSGQPSRTISHSDIEDGVHSIAQQQRESDDSLETLDEELYKENLNVFVPTKQVYSEREQLLWEEMSINTFQPREVDIQILPSTSTNIPNRLDAFVFLRGDVSMFPQPKSHNRIFGYYLMDAASVMPVLALDLHPTDQVLDLCAAPGGKSYLILQCLDMFAGGTLHCNDVAQGRISRMKNVLNSYFPPDIANEVMITKKDGTEFEAVGFNKVLVDVPCNSDRHVVTEDENNLFKISRTRERLGLMETQKDLLISGIKSCVAGGSVVYSTCTLSPAQNDGVIQAAVEELHETSEIEVAVQDLSLLTKLFSHVFKFHGLSRYGLQILPSLVNNFGPSYCAKLKRIK